MRNRLLFAVLVLSLLSPYSAKSQSQKPEDKRGEISSLVTRYIDSAANAGDIWRNASLTYVSTGKEAKSIHAQILKLADTSPMHMLHYMELTSHLLHSPWADSISDPSLDKKGAEVVKAFEAIASRAFLLGHTLPVNASQIQAVQPEEPAEGKTLALSVCAPGMFGPKRVTIIDSSIPPYDLAAVHIHELSHHTQSRDRSRLPTLEEEFVEEIYAYALGQVLQRHLFLQHSIASKHQNSGYKIGRIGDRVLRIGGYVAMPPSAIFDLGRWFASHGQEPMQNSYDFNLYNRDEKSPSGKFLAHHKGQLVSALTCLSNAYTCSSGYIYLKAVGKKLAQAEKRFKEVNLKAPPNFRSTLLDHVLQTVVAEKRQMDTSEIDAWLESTSINCQDDPHKPGVEGVKSCIGLRKKDQT